MKMYFHSGILALAALTVLTLSSCTDQSSAGNAAGEADSLSVASAHALAPAGDIAYFNVDEVVGGYDKAADLMSEFENKAKKALDNLERKGKQIAADYQKLVENTQKGLILQSSAEKQAQDIQSRQDKFNQEYAKKQDELAQEQAVINNNIMNDISEFLQSYNQIHGYRLILSNQTGLLSVPVALADPSMNITQDVIDGLNAKYAGEKQ